MMIGGPISAHRQLLIFLSLAVIVVASGSHWQLSPPPPPPPQLIAVYTCVYAPPLLTTPSPFITLAVTWLSTMIGESNWKSSVFAVPPVIVVEIVLPPASSMFKMFEVAGDEKPLPWIMPLARGVELAQMLPTLLVTVTLPLDGQLARHCASVSNGPPSLG